MSDVDYWERDCFGGYSEQDEGYKYRFCLDCEGVRACVVRCQRVQQAWVVLAARVAAGGLGGANDGAKRGQ